MKKATKRLLGIFMFSILLSGMTLAQINESDGLRMPGDWNSFTNSNGMGGDFDLTKISTGTTRWQTTFQFTGTTGTQNFKFASGGTNPWANQWAQVTGVSLNTITSVNWTTNGSVGNNSISVTNNKYYTVNWKDNAYATTDFIFMETSAEPVSISSVSYGTNDSDSITVNITLSGSKSTEEKIYVRYSTDNFSSSKHILATGTGTAYTARVPASATTQFYILTSTLSLGDNFTTYSGDYDMATIKFNNNSGSNYTYTYAFSRQITGDAGWRLLSLPKTGGLVTDVSDDTPVQGVTGGDDASSTTNFIIYDNDAEFEKPTNVTTAWGDGLGFGLYFYNNTTNGSSTLPVTLDASGAEPSSDVTVTLNPAASGYTLVGNPYASNYNTNSMTATSSNISNTIAFWNDGTSSYSTQDRTASSGYIISPWQGFWVQTVSAAATTLTMPTSGKTSSSTTGTFFSKEVNNRGDINFSLSSETTYDEAIRLAFRSEATTEYDADDFGKLTPLVPSYAIMAFESNDILKSVESLPYNLEEEVTLSLQPQMVGVSGDFTFAWNGLETIPGEWELILHDYETGANIDMRSETEYTFFQAAHAKVSSNPLSLLNGPAAVAMKAKAEGNRFGITIRPTSVSNETEESPALFALEQNYPNPFNPSTTISYSVQEAGAVNISVYNLMGQKVATLVDETKATGQYNVRWNAAGAASGMYYYRLEAGGQSITRKMTLIK
jgi:hypothetical protein